MGGLNIRLRIWLSVGIFLFGYLLSTVADQLTRRISENDFRMVSDVLVPAARSGSDSTDAFNQVVESYQENFVVQNPSGLGRASNQAERVLGDLAAIAQSKDVPPARASEALRLSSMVRQYANSASATFARVPTRGDRIPEELQRAMLGLRREARQLEVELSSFDGELANDVEMRLGALRRRSASMRLFALILFASTVITAMAAVNLTIERAIMAPLAKAQAELAHERDLLRLLLDHIPDAIYFIDAQSNFIRVNKASASVMGLDNTESAIGRSPADYFDLDTSARINADHRAIFSSGQSMISKIERVSRSGISRWMNTTKVLARQETSSVPLIVGISRDITEWKETMEELRRSEASFRLLFAVIPQAIFVCNAETLAILEVNDAATRTYGYSSDEFHRMRLSDIYPSEDCARLKRTFEQLGPAKPWRGLRKHVTKDGRVLDVEIADHFFEFRGRRTALVTAQDVSEKKRLEVELQHAQRLEAVGQLAAGIAHEINTPIQYVGDNLRFLADGFRDRQSVLAQYGRLLEAVLRGQVPAGLIDQIRTASEGADLEYLEQEIPRALEQSLDGVERVATIVRAMKSFAHPGGDEKKPADLNKALSDALIVARNEFKYVADVVTEFGALPTVWCNLGDLNQVFLNLLVNAAHAITDVVQASGGRGKIQVRTCVEGNQAIVSISDTGSGIPAAIQSRVFDPFFTTKEVGKGTGQGLAIARNIVVEKHGGRIWFQPNAPQGTIFLLSLPIEGSRETDPGGSQELEAAVS